MNFIEDTAKLHFGNFLNNKLNLRYIVRCGPNTTTIFLFYNSNKNPFGILRISPKKDRVGREYKVLNVMKNINNQKKYNNIYPEPIYYSEYRELQIASYLYLVGFKMIPKPTDILILKNHLTTVRKWLEGLWKLSLSLSLSDTQINEIFPYVTISEKFSVIFEKSKIESEILNGLFDKIRLIENEILNKNFKKVICHGDLRPQHIFLKNKFDIVGVIDWECSFLGWTPVDWFYFLCSYFCPIPLKVSINDMLEILKKNFFEYNNKSKIILNETEKLFDNISLNRELMYNFFILGLFNYLFTITFSNLSRFKEVIPIFYENNNIFNMRLK